MVFNKYTIILSLFISTEYKQHNSGRPLVIHNSTLDCDPKELEDN